MDIHKTKFRANGCGRIRAVPENGSRIEQPGWSRYVPQASRLPWKYGCSIFETALDAENDMKTSPDSPASPEKNMNAAKTGPRIEHRRKWYWTSIALPFVGLVSLLWFLIRVIPKPSRATYPCQRAAFPMASAFVIWLSSLVVSSMAYCKARRLALQCRHFAATLFTVVAVVMAMFHGSNSVMKAQAEFVPSDPPNSPMGVGKGIHPGRVAWIHDPNATKWDGVTDHWWDEQNLDQHVVDRMLYHTLKTLTGEQSDAAAWNALFRYFNRTHGRGDIGYQPGEKIAIKINLNEEGYGPAYSGNGRMPSPQMIYSLLTQLFNQVQVSGADVTIYDASRAIADPLYNRIRGDADPNYQNVRFVANTTVNGRIGAVYDPSAPVHFANLSVSPANNATAYLPTCVTEATYLIDMALLSGHSMFGMTACGKNWFGSICWMTNANYWPWNGGWTPSPLHSFGMRDNPMGTYNPIVDLIGHPQLGGKTLLYLVDGLYGSDNAITRVLRFWSFDNHWTASMFASQDPIAIDSVMVDILRNEPLLAANCSGQGVDNYLHEAAQADHPTSNSFYDPAGTGSRLASLGVHEHWNNASDRLYSRNLGGSEGIELIPAGGPGGDPDGDGMNNTTEYQAGTDPMDPDSTPFRFDAITQQGDDILVEWTTQGGTSNRVQVASNLDSNSFANLSPAITSTGNYLASTNYLDIGGATNTPARYYRVQLNPKNPL